MEVTESDKRDKHSSLLHYRINYSPNKFYDTGPQGKSTSMFYPTIHSGACIIKLFTAVINSVVQ